jgi:transcriptional regulator NrdR family protein
MHCRQCGSKKNKVSNATRRNAQGIYRIRQCITCDSIWSTVEKLEPCRECGSENYEVTRVQHHGPDEKLRERACRDCAAKQYSFEKKTTDRIERKIA